MVAAKDPALDGCTLALTAALSEGLALALFDTHRVVLAAQRLSTTGLIVAAPVAIGAVVAAIAAVFRISIMQGAKEASPMFGVVAGDSKRAVDKVTKSRVLSIRRMHRQLAGRAGHQTCVASSGRGGAMIRQALDGFEKDLILARLAGLHVLRRGLQLFHPAD